MKAVVSVERLGQGPMPTDSPFLFAVHHLDTYPAGDAKMAPAASLRGHNMGADFGHADGWSMYHGEEVPGFPKHPHRGFETITATLAGGVHCAACALRCFALRLYTAAALVLHCCPATADR